MANMIPLSDAAQQLSMSWERAWRALLNGDLEGEKRDGRWYVTVSSVRLYERRGRNSTPSSRAASLTDEMPG